MGRLLLRRDMEIFHQLPVGGRHASRNVAETIRCDFFIAKNLDSVQWHCPYQKQCNGNVSNVVSYIPTSFRRRVSADDVGRRWSDDKRVIRWLHALTYTLDNLDICIVCIWKACWRLKQNSKDCQALFSQWCCFLLFLKKSTFLVSFLLSFRWLSVLSNVLSEGIHEINVYECLWRHA